MCPKCKNHVLVSEPATDRENGQTVYLERCPICGYYGDATMKKNKRNPILNPKDLTAHHLNPPVEL